VRARAGPLAPIRQQRSVCNARVLLSMHVHGCLSVYLSLCLYVCLCYLAETARPAVCLSVCLSVCLVLPDGDGAPRCLSVCLSVCLVLPDGDGAPACLFVARVIAMRLAPGHGGGSARGVPHGPAPLPRAAAAGEDLRRDLH
jgi:hypothetical protein